MLKIAAKTVNQCLDDIFSTFAGESPYFCTGGNYYPNLDRVLVEVFTLDSGSCAPCQYMMESVQRTAPEFHRRIEFIERSVNHKDAIARMKLIGVGNIPTILIDGETAFASLIPSDHELISAIRARVERKGLG